MTTHVASQMRHSNQRTIGMMTPVIVRTALTSIAVQRDVENE